jgi:hypothetical protein
MTRGAKKSLATAEGTINGAGERAWRKIIAMLL